MNTPPTHIYRKSLFFRKMHPSAISSSIHRLLTKFVLYWHPSSSSSDRFCSPEICNFFPLRTLSSPLRHPSYHSLLLPRPHRTKHYLPLSFFCLRNISHLRHLWSFCRPILPECLRTITRGRHWPCRLRRTRYSLAQGRMPL